MIHCVYGRYTVYMLLCGHPLGLQGLSIILECHTLPVTANPANPLAGHHRKPALLYPLLASLRTDKLRQGIQAGAVSLSQLLMVRDEMRWTQGSSLSKARTHNCQICHRLWESQTKEPGLRSCPEPELSRSGLINMFGLSLYLWTSP